MPVGAGSPGVRPEGWTRLPGAQRGGVGLCSVGLWRWQGLQAGSLMPRETGHEWPAGHLFRSLPGLRVLWGCLLSAPTIHTLSFDTESLPPADQAPGLPLAHQKPRNPGKVNASSSEKDSGAAKLPQTTATTRRSTGADCSPSVHSGRLKRKHYNPSTQKM